MWLTSDSENNQRAMISLSWNIAASSVPSESGASQPGMSDVWQGNRGGKSQEAVLQYVERLI